jgi:acetylornithine deacetylase/succinyl-diaminopimelate desuccinylase-like protein
VTEAINLYVAKHGERLVDEWREACRIPSIASGPPEHLRAMAEWVRERVGRVLDTAEVVEVEGAPPIVLGEARGRQPYRLLLYSHYDVQPADPDEGWTTPPFAAERSRDVVVGRGVCDDKADVVARLQALEAWRELHGELPVGVIWLCEGAEEVGSPGLAGFVEANRERLSADGCLWESYLRRDDGRPEVGFGCRGLVYVELSLRVLASDQHSAFASIFRSAPHELARALSTLVDATGRVVIDGFHDDVLSLTEADAAALAEIDPPAVDQSAFLVADPRELARRMLFEPTANVAGLWSGYTGPGAKTIIPAEAHAKLDFRLVPRQDPEDVLRKLRAHLDANGFDEVQIEVLNAIPPARSAMDSALGRAVLRASEDTMGPAIRLPLVPGSGPLHTVVEALGLPVVMPGGVTRLESGIHAPNEHARVDDYLDTVRLNLRILEELASL